MGNPSPRSFQTDGSAPVWGASPIPEPYAYVPAGGFSGASDESSPDPLIGYRWSNPRAEDDLEIFLRRPVRAATENPASFGNLASLTTERPNVEVTGNGTVVLDFGAEFAGWLEIDSPDLSGAVELGVSEYNRPAFVNAGPKSPSKTAAPKKYGAASYRLELNDELYEGVRFGFLRVAGFRKPFHVTGVRLVCQTKPVNYNGSFRSDSGMLNRIWAVAAYDVRVNLKKDYFSAILVDRGDRYSWTGDAYPAQAAALVAFANYDFVLGNLEFTERHSNGIESYELYWIFSLIDYYRYTGDRDGTAALLNCACRRLDHAYEIYGTDARLNFFGWDERLGAGFENPEIPENRASYQFLAIRAWNGFAGVLSELGREREARKYREWAARKTAEWKAGGGRRRKLGLHAGADAINAGLLSKSETAEFSRKFFTDRVNRLSYSPFNEFFILQAMGKAGRYDDALSAVCDMWGGQIAYGGTTFFETYRPQWNDGTGRNGPVPNNQAGYTSLAHPWGAGVLPWLQENILGIRPSAAGFSSFVVTPHLGRRLKRVSGTVPTPHGGICASFDTAAGKCSVTVPRGTVADVGIPKTERTITAVRMNRRPADCRDEDQDFLYFRGLREGQYEFDVVYRGETPAPEDAGYRYGAAFEGEDRETGGDWGGVYGSEGYDLFSYDGPGKDRSALPGYVCGVSYRKARCAQWTRGTDDVRALPAGGGSGTRKLGALLTNDPVACDQTFTLDIRLKEEREYTVALYFADWQKSGRQLAVEMFDGDTLDLVAPVRFVRDYAAGVYLVYRYGRSSRFRIDQVRGENATLSGIFFGPAGRNA